ncbi:serine/threonine-protein kinase [Actinoplanes sp. Pm04-4]|uniref:non-specific serine/threonine protein kinase n=1 Tax=Paractinoplanes pyxinae TaxID=2997416 RepID=A0ABT4BFP8_9ACTN|nr:serine/threonine-protein kinase [Actinoplanes pyxinae]MCY1145373.1 serine/threonine-protein kinase [Actinoplanes pyxinae]
MDLSGRCVGNSYVLQRPIGQGATGTVWEALDRSTGKSVAVKLLHETLLGQPRLVTRFVQERTILRMLRHRNVVRVHDLFSVGETIGLVMDLVGGGSLRDLLRTQPTLAVGEAARLTAQVAAALAEAHDLGVVHRDLKPDNILLASVDGRLDTRLTDFGVARILNTPSMTTPNAVVGTPHYMSPEAFHGATANPATDVYALGVLLYELVSGRPPYLSDSIPDLMRQHLEGNPARRPGVPGPIWDLIMSCLAQKPRLRPSAAELVADLSDLSRRFADVPALPASASAGALAEPPRSAPVLHSASLPPAGDDAWRAVPGEDDPWGVPAAGDDAWRVSPTGDKGAGAPEPNGDKEAGAPESNGDRGVGLPPGPAISIVPPQRHPGRRNVVPGWRWARPGATMALIAAAMVASAVATTAWNMGRDNGRTQDLAAPRVIVQTAPTAAAPATSTVAQRRTNGAANRNAGRAPVKQKRPAPAVSAPTSAATPDVVRTKTPQPPTKRKPTRSSRTEVDAYGPWQCNGSLAIDFKNRTAAKVEPCHMVGPDVRMQASVTAPGGGRGSITVSLRESGTGRIVGARKTCDGLVFDGDVSTRTCGPSSVQPTRGRTYAVVMSFDYDRDGRSLTSEARGSTFTW